MPDIRHSISIDAAPERIFPLVSSGSGFSRWWAVDVIQAGSKGAVDLGFFRRATVYRLKPVHIDAPREAEWLCQTGAEWSGTHISFKLTAHKDQTLLQFTHGGWKSESDYFVACNTTWGELMYRLKAASEGKPVSPLFSADGLAY